jgi:MFS family permease
MTVADILDGSFKLLSANLATIVILTSLFVVPVNLVAAFVQRGALGGVSFLNLFTDPESFTEEDLEAGFFSLTDLGVLALTALFTLATAPFVAGLISRVAGSSYLGTRLEWGPALRGTAGRFFTLLGAFILVHLAEFGPFLINSVLFVLATVLDGGVLLTVVLGLLLPVTLLLSLVGMAFFLPVAPAVVMEGLGPVRAMRRSWRLVQPRFWVVLGIGILSGIVAYVLAQIVATPFSLGAAGIGYGIGWPLLALGSIIPALITTPFLAIVATLVYFDARMRHEAFDLELAASELNRDRPQGGGAYG